jgi:hypothetical protein
LREISRRGEIHDALEQRKRKREQKRDKSVAIHHGYRRAAVLQLWFAAIGGCVFKKVRSRLSKMRGSQIWEYSPRMYTRQGSVLIFFCFMRIPILDVSCYLLLRDRLRVTGEMEKLASDGIY